MASSNNVYHPASSPSYKGYTSTVSPASQLSEPTEIIPPPPISKSDGTSTSALQTRLTSLRSKSSELSTELTKKLATSRSGQSLLHIGPSLSTLPPDLSTLIDALDPLLAEVEEYEKENVGELKRLVALGSGIRKALWRSEFGVECGEIYEDLCGAEEVLRIDGKGKDGDMEYELHYVNSLERAAYTTLFLLQELQSSSSQVSAMTGVSSFTSPTKDDSATNSLPTLMSVNDCDMNGVIIEKSRFLMKLSPRIRKLESDTAKCLVAKLEELLTCIRNDAMESGEDGSNSKKKDNILLMIGNCLRGLALLGKGADAESAFARVAIMPIIRSKLSIGKLDEGGARGECAGLFFLLDDIANTIASIYGSLLRSSEGMFTHDDTSAPCEVAMEVDLVVSGVWVPVVTALMADPGIKTAIFSPGIANILQANYSALNTFLSELASNLLKSPGTEFSNDDRSNIEPTELGDFSHLYYQTTITASSIERAQRRLYSHHSTIQFSKKWNLPIYYQLRFAEFCKRLDKAIDRVSAEGWEADVFTGEEKNNQLIRDQLGFELPLFIEMYDILLSMWRSNVFLRPLTHRFIRGAVQLVGRVLTFIKDGLNGNIEFGGTNETSQINTLSQVNEEGGTTETVVGVPSYLWNERVEDLATVSWELTILETCMTHDYLDVVSKTVCPADEESRKSTHNSSSELEEIRSIFADVLLELTRDISPLIESSWNKLIVDNLTSRCCIPLSAVKGVAATYRMTNRPPPSQASPFVGTILRPLKEFDTSYSSRTPPQIADVWKHKVIEIVTDKYSVAVEELIATVKRTEEALKSRQTRRTMIGGMSDGEKVKLQLYLDYQEFKSYVENLGVDSECVIGLKKLRDLTQEAESLYEQTQTS